MAEQDAAELKDLLADNADQSRQIEPLVNLVRRRMQFLSDVGKRPQSGMSLAMIQKQRMRRAGISSQRSVR